MLYLATLHVVKLDSTAIVGIYVPQEIHLWTKGKRRIKNDRLSFPSLECIIDAAAGRGAGFLAYTGHYSDREDPQILHRVLILVLFLFDPLDGIRRSESCDLITDPSSELLYTWYR